MVTLGPYDYTGPSTRFYGDGWLISQNQGGNYSTLRGQVTCYNGPSGSTGSYHSGWGRHMQGFDGYGWVVNHERTPFLPSGYAQNQLRWQEAGDVNIGHDANGNHGGVNTRLHVEYGGGGGVNSEWIAYVGLPRIPKLPPATVNGAVDEPSPTSLRYRFSGNGDGGSAIIRWEAQWSTTSDFSSGNGPVTTSSGTTTFNNLAPGTTHYFRSRGVNALGNGPWGAGANGTTLPSVPPGFVVASSPSGSQATLTFSPPGGVTGVSKYTWERRATGTTEPVATGESTVISTVVADLVPGNSYDWRASAWIGGYQSPWTDDGPLNWTTLVQAKPNTTPGDYFDGGTVDVADIDYSWTGAANASTSVATAKGVLGWGVIFHSGAGVLYRVTAGILQSDYAARVQVTADTAQWGEMEAGQARTAPYWTEVTPGATYIGSIHVRPSRSQSMAAEVVWLNAAGAKIGSVLGAGSVVAGGTWARVVAGGIAPAGAAWATVSAFDQQGTGWSVWHGGDTLDLDGAMISLNEEFPYFDGDYAADGTYVYEWNDEPNKSVSTRTPLAQAQQAGAFMPELGGLFLPSRLAITDPDCNVVPNPPRPPVVASDCIEDVGVWRRYYTEIPADLVPDWLDVVPTLDITSGSKAARQVRIRYYANPDAKPPSGVDTTKWISEQIISFMPAKTVLTLDGVTQHVWAEVNNSVPISADHLLYGTNGKPATWPVLSCGIAYLVSIEVPIAEPAGNIVVAASLTART